MGTDWTGFSFGMFLDTKLHQHSIRSESAYQCSVCQNLRIRDCVYLLAGCKFHSDRFVDRVYWNTNIFILILLYTFCETLL